MAKITKKASQKKTTQLTKKVIRIACEGAALVSIDELTDFQGSLKVLSEERYQKLRALILKLGFSFAVAAWKSGNTIYVIDAHQRLATLRRLRDQEGYQVPLLPVFWVEASNDNEAAQKVLAATSQFGEITYEGLFDFMVGHDFEMPLLKSDFVLPEIDMDRFEKTFFPEEKEVSFKVKAKIPDDEKSSPEADHNECPKCGYRIR